MACKDETKIIGGAEYYTRQWPASKALLTKLKMTKMFGPSIAKLIPSLEGEDLGCLAGSVQALFEVSDPETLLSFMQEVVSCATRNGERITKENFDTIYTDNLLEFYQAFGFVLKVNYASFFGGKLGQVFLKKMEEKLSDGSKATAPT